MTPLYSSPYLDPGHEHCDGDGIAEPRLPVTESLKVCITGGGGGSWNAEGIVLFNQKIYIFKRSINLMNIVWNRPEN